MVTLALARIFARRVRRALNTGQVVTQCKMNWLCSVDTRVERVGQQVALVRELRAALDTISGTGTSRLALSFSTSFRARSCAAAVGTVNERVLGETARGSKLVAPGWSVANAHALVDWSTNIITTRSWHAKLRILARVLLLWNMVLFGTGVQRVRLITVLGRISATASIANLPATTWVKRTLVWTSLHLAVVRANLFRRRD